MYAYRPEQRDKREEARTDACRINHNARVIPATSIFHNPAWVAVIVALIAIPIGIAVPFIVARWQTGRKALGYGVASASLVRDTARGRLTIFFADRQVSRVALITVTLVNVGNQPIRREDFDGPIRVRYGADAEILDADLVSVEPSSLSPEMTVADDAGNGEVSSRRCVEIAPLLLNSGDSLSVEAIVDGHDGSVESVDVEGRIAGISKLDRFDEEAASTGALIAVAAVEAAALTMPALLPGWRTATQLARVIRVVRRKL